MDARAWLLLGLVVNGGCSSSERSEANLGPSSEAGLEDGDAEAPNALVEVRAKEPAFDVPPHDAATDVRTEGTQQSAPGVPTSSPEPLADDDAAEGTFAASSTTAPWDGPDAAVPLFVVEGTDAAHADGGLDAGDVDAGGTRELDAADANAAFTLEAAPPQLSGLHIEGARTLLYPAFDPARTRYSIIADNDGSTLGVTAIADGAWALHVNGVPLTSDQRMDLSNVAPGSQLVFTVGEELGATPYIVEYLPDNFPELFAATPQPGATNDPLYMNLDSGIGQFLVKLDNAGVPLFYREEPYQIYDFKKQPDGTHSYAVRRANKADGAHLVLLDQQFAEMRRVSAVGLTNTDAHDFLKLPNGNHVFMSYEPGVHDLTPYGLSATESVIDTIFQEVTPDNQVVFQWNSWDHVRYDESVYAYKKQDYAHGNSVAVDHDGHWLLSSRGLSQVYKINRSTGDVIWRLGGVSSDFEFVNDPFNGFCGQHTVERLDNGHILLFDNSRDCLPDVLGSRPARSRAAEYVLDEVAMTAELVWSYERDGVMAYHQGSAQRLSNGNTMIGWGSGSQVLATEVTREGDVVFELTGRAQFNLRLSSYRARRFAD